MDTTQIRELWVQMKPEVDRIAKEARTLSRVVKKLTTEEGYEALKKLQKEILAIEEVKLHSDGLLDNVATALEPVRDWLDKEWTRRAGDFAEELHHFFADREVEMTGIPPVMRAGPLTIEFDTRQDQAGVFYAGEPVKNKIPLAPNRIFREWLKACQGLEKAQTAPEEFFAMLVSASEEVTRANGLRQGARVRLPDLHFQLFIHRQTAKVKQDPRKGRIKEYPRYQFIYDLAGLISSPGGLVRGKHGLLLHVAAKSAAESRSTSVFVPDDQGGGTYYSDLQIEEQ